MLVLHQQGGTWSPQLDPHRQQKLLSEEKSNLGFFIRFNLIRTVIKELIVDHNTTIIPAVKGWYPFVQHFLILNRIMIYLFESLAVIVDVGQRRVAAF